MTTQAITFYGAFPVCLARGRKRSASSSPRPLGLPPSLQEGEGISNRTGWSPEHEGAMFSWEEGLTHLHREPPRWDPVLASPGLGSQDALPWPPALHHILPVSFYLVSAPQSTGSSLTPWSKGLRFLFGISSLIVEGIAVVVFLCAGHT